MFGIMAEVVRKGRVIYKNRISSKGIEVIGQKNKGKANKFQYNRFPLPNNQQ
jgi:hypothetical protein